MNTNLFSNNFPDFGDSIRRNAKRFPMLVELVAAAIAFADPKTPIWAKSILGAAVAYVLSPFDAIPDFIPIAGWADDIGVMGAAIAGVAGIWITEEHRQQARQMLGLAP